MAFRNDLDAAHLRIAELERENQDLRLALLGSIRLKLLQSARLFIDQVSWPIFLSIIVLGAILAGYVMAELGVSWN